MDLNFSVISPVKPYYGNCAGCALVSHYFRKIKKSETKKETPNVLLAVETAGNNLIFRKFYYL